MSAALQHELQRENARLRRAVQELSILNELAAEIGRARHLEDIMQLIVRKARRAVRAGEGVITLLSEELEGGMKTLVRTRAKAQLPQAIRPTSTLLERMRAERTPIIVGSKDATNPTDLGLSDPGVRTAVCVPMLVAGRLTGILTLYNRDPAGDFSPEDIRLLSIIAAQSAQVIEHARLEEERRSIIQTFGQFTAPDVVEKILRHGTDIEGTRQYVCILFMDVRGFSTFAERAAPEKVVTYLSTLFDITIACVNRHHGIVNQLLGDGLMAIFGAPVAHGRDTDNAVRASLEMVEQVNAAADGGRIPPTRIGIGLHAGEVVAGMIGSAVHREYKVTGDVVNVAARLEQLNKTYDSTLLISGAVYDELDPKPESAESLGSIVLDGRRESVPIFRLA